jgi:hypothetical protein
MSIECRHCQGTGTCATGVDGNSCDSCVAKVRAGPLPFMKNNITSTKGLPCGACQGAGDIAGRVWHLQSTIGPILGLFIVLFVLGIVAGIAASSPAHHTQVLTLLGTLAGGVVGYYFRGQHSAPKSPGARTPKPKSTPTPS